MVGWDKKLILAVIVSILPLFARLFCKNCHDVLECPKYQNSRKYSEQKVAREHVDSFSPLLESSIELFLEEVRDCLVFSGDDLGFFECFESLRKEGNISVVLSHKSDLFRFEMLDFFVWVHSAIVGKG